MNIVDRKPVPALAEAQSWLDGFAAALQSHDAAAAADLFVRDGLWRDLLAFTWTIQTMAGRPAIEATLRQALAHGPAKNFRIPPKRTPPRWVSRAGSDCIEVIFEFDAAFGFGNGVVRLVPGPEAPSRLRAWTLNTNLQEIEGHEEAFKRRPPEDSTRDFGAANWLDRLTQQRAFADRDPAVLVVGGGQAGLSIAARLHQLGVDTLIVDRHGSYDEQRKQWNVTLRRADGATRVMHPRHLIFATGVSSIPYFPDVPGLDAFAGPKVHSGSFANAEQWKGRKALVLGSGTSGHDVVQELHAHGAEVTLIQRSPTYVVSLKEAQSVYAIYSEGIPIEDCDLLATSFPYPVLQRSYQLSTARGREVDKALLDALTARGFRLHFGEDETGFQMMYLRRGGGYYFNVGCSDLIVSGQIKLLQFSDIETFEPEGARLRDGRVLPAELLVLATGYKNQQDSVRAYLGDAIADKVGPVWGFDAGGELRNMWRRTAQPGLWFTAGSLAQCRIFSRYLALQIKALEEGLIT